MYLRDLTSKIQRIFECSEIGDFLNLLNLNLLSLKSMLFTIT